MVEAQGAKAQRNRRHRAKRTKQTEQGLHHALAEAKSLTFRLLEFVIACPLVSPLLRAALKHAWLFSILTAAVTSWGADYPAPVEGDYVIRNFKFTSGESLPELRIHYRTIGKAEKD